VTGTRHDEAAISALERVPSDERAGTQPSHGLGYRLECWTLAEVPEDCTQVVAFVPFLGLDEIAENGNSQLVDRQHSCSIGVDVDHFTTSGVRSCQVSHAARPRLTMVSPWGSPDLPEGWQRPGRR
jgi:hypothetical protein